MPAKETQCLDCKGKVLSLGKIRLRCPTCADIYRNNKVHKRKSEQRKQRKQILVATTNKEVKK